MVRPRESIRFLRICWDIVPCNTEEIGIQVYRMLSSPTTIVIKRVWRCRRLRCYMVECVKPCCFGVRLENGRFLDPTYCKKLRSKFTWWERTYGLRNQDKSYTDHRRREFSFEVEDFVYLKVPHMRGLCHFNIQGKLAPWCFRSVWLFLFYHYGWRVGLEILSVGIKVLP
jgi:hypothetical protein